MKIKQLFLLSLVLLLTNVKDINSQTVSPQKYASKNQWDIVFSFQTPEMGVGCVATNGQYIYTAEWSGINFAKYDMEGNFIEEFEIANAGSIHDLAYDGQYFYGTNTYRNIQVLDLDNKTLVNDFEVDDGVDVDGIRHITYDPTLDNNNGGFWVGNYHSLAAMNKNGMLLISNFDTPEIPNVTRGTAWDNTGSPGSPKLWLFSEEPYPSNKVMMLEFDINSLSFTGVQHNVSDLPGYNSDLAEAGGAFAYEKDGKFILAGCSRRHRPEYDIIFGYELYTTINENSPTEISNFTATADAMGNYEATLNWTNPSTDVSGNTLTQLDSVVLYLGAEKIHTITNPSIGATDSYTANTSSHGDYQFKAICYNGSNYSVPAYCEQFIGVDLSISQLDIPAQAHVNETITPIIKVKNHSSNTQSYNIELSSNNYLETIHVDNHSPELETAYEFPEFTYNISSTTIFRAKIIYSGTDFNPNNNEMLRSTMVTDGIDDNFINRLQIYPNPVKDIISINTDTKYQLIISNISGKLIYKGAHQGAAQINLQNQAKGIYNVQIETERQVINQKIIIK